MTKESKLRMKKITFLTFGLMVLFSVFLVGCSTAQATTSTPVVTSASSTAASGETVLTIKKGDKTVTYTMAELKALTVLSGWGGKSTMHGSEAPAQFKGVAMSQLLKSIGGMTDKDSLVVTAKDNYSRTLTFDQVVNGNFTVMDNSGNAVTPSKTPVLFVAYEQNGGALDTDSGTIMLGIMTAQNQLTGGDNWVRDLTKIEIISAQ